MGGWVGETYLGEVFQPTYHQRGLGPVRWERVALPMEELLSCFEGLDGLYGVGGWVGGWERGGSNEVL